MKLRPKGLVKRVVRWLLVLFQVTLISCAQLPKSENSTTDKLLRYKPKKIDTQEHFQLKLKFNPDLIEVNNYNLRTQTQTFENGQLIHEKEDSTDFSIRTVHKSEDLKLNQFTLLTNPISVDGPADLHDLGFPDLGEVLELTLNSRGQVLKAGFYPKDSLFYIPPISLPDRSVQVGDTWSIQHKWNSLKNGIPLILDMVSIFKSVYSCQGVEKDQSDHLCAEIEVSGDVKVDSNVSSEIEILSLLQGRLLFSIQTGSIIWAEIRNFEKFKSGKIGLEVYSCIESMLMSPESKKWTWKLKPDCDLTKKTISAIPGTN
jgi:hypothetical protein